MSHGKGTQARDSSLAASHTSSVANMLRELATRVESNPTLAERVLVALRAEGLLTTEEHVTGRRGKRRASAAPLPIATRRANESVSTDPQSTLPPDPFAVLRARGEEGLRTALQPLELPVLRSIVRTYRLDPARISARWTARDRVISLIVTQALAQINQGKAFARV
ncbi:MAG: hypothetical protein OJF49_004836 [Ktedonobacterales bacterium]|nr:MAG: hypothetical protein OJF49_004836 [Ktedonobacterales bacterium]